jgi:hypothetical protein
MKTYQWALMPDVEKPEADDTNDLMHRFFRVQVDRIMAEKGYEKLTKGADMELDYRIMILPEKRELYQANEIAAAEYGVEWRFDRDTLPERRTDWKKEQPEGIEFYQKGKLIIGAIDTRSGKAIWLRSAAKPLNPDADDAERKAVLETIAEKLMDPFPERGE